MTDLYRTLNLFSFFTTGTNNTLASALLSGFLCAHHSSRKKQSSSCLDACVHFCMRGRTRLMTWTPLIPPAKTDYSYMFGSKQQQYLTLFLCLINNYTVSSWTGQFVFLTFFSMNFYLKGQLPVMARHVIGLSVSSLCCIRWTEWTWDITSIGLHAS